MTREEFIEILKEKRYPYKIEGDKIVVIRKGDVNLGSLTSIPPDVVFNNEGRVLLNDLTSLPHGVEFRNGWYVSLRSLTSIHPGVEFRNDEDVLLSSLTGGWFTRYWKGNIEGIDSKRLLNLMISKGVFER